MSRIECASVSRAVAQAQPPRADRAVGRASVPTAALRRAVAPSQRHSQRAAAGALRRARGTAPVVFASASATTPAKTGTKDQLKAEIAGSSQNRSAINELLLKLEASNPTEAPTSSGKLTGTWSFAYNGSIAPGPIPSPTRPLALAMYAGGFSPGTLGLQVANMLPKDFVTTDDFTLSIAGIGPYSATASIVVKAFGREVSVKVGTNLTIESDRRLLETYQSVEVDGRSTEVPASLQYERTMYISYLDDDIMVARDETGAPDVLYRVSSDIDMDEWAVTQSDPIEEMTTSVADAAAEMVDSISDAIDDAQSFVEDKEEEMFDSAREAVTEAKSFVESETSTEVTAAGDDATTEEDSEDNEPEKKSKKGKK